MPITRKPFGYRDGTILWRTRAEQEKAVAEIAKVRNGVGRARALGPSVIPNRRVRTVD